MERLDDSGSEHLFHALLDEFATLWNGKARLLAKRDGSRLELYTVGYASHQSQVTGPHILVARQYAVLAIRPVFDVVKVNNLTPIRQVFGALGLAFRFGLIKGRKTDLLLMRRVC